MDNIDAEILSAAWDSADGDATADYYYHYDGQGNVIALTDTSGNVVEEYEYDVYGRVVVSASSGQIRTGSSVGNPYMFTGRRLDKETGLYYYRARYYSPRLGRFLQTDPIGYGDGINWYAYCGNNPLGWIDPYGLCQNMAQWSAERDMYNFRSSVWNAVATALDWSYNGAHVGMDIAGAVPGIGEPVDFIHGVALAGEAMAGTREGAALESGLTLAAILPIIGEEAKVANTQPSTAMKPLHWHPSTVTKLQLLQSEG